MKLSKLSTLVALSVNALFSSYLSSKTLIIDDFLQHQDTSNMKFDLAHSQPSERLSPYSSQFVAVSENFYKDGAIGCLPLTLKNPEQIFDRFFYCKNGKTFNDMNEFEKRKYPENVKEIYVEKYKEHVGKIDEYINGINRVEFRKFFTLFKSEKYDFERGYYVIDSDNERWNNDLYVNSYLDYSLISADTQGKYNIRGIFNKDFAKDVFNRFVNDGEKYSLVFDMPMSIAEKLYEISTVDIYKNIDPDIPLVISNMVFEKENRCIVSKYDNCFRPVFEEFSFEIVSVKNGSKRDRLYPIAQELERKGNISERFYNEVFNPISIRDGLYDINSRNVLFKTNGVTVMDEDKNGRVNYVYSLEAVND